MNETQEIPTGYMADSKGRLVPESQIRPADLLEDQTVKEIMSYADELSAQIARFKGHTFDDIGAFMAVLAEKYNVKRGGKKGNLTLTSYNGTLKVTLQQADRLDFGPSLQVAKDLVDVCIKKWSEDVNAHIRTLVDHAFSVDKEGKINREALFALRRVEIDDPDWKKAMEALTDSIRVEGSKSYLRFYRRETPQDRWEAVTIDLAAA